MTMKSDDLEALLELASECSNKAEALHFIRSQCEGIRYCLDLVECAIYRFPESVLAKSANYENNMSKLIKE